MKEFNVMPNIRLANGLVKQETRQRLMLAFNTPFFPEVLVASSVLAEGVDLHLSCRYVIHHDLSWNPSTLEQRTGRVDRIGAKAEMVSKPIEVFLPYIGGTQDEKQYRVVMDRERWFQVLMGEDYRTDEVLHRARGGPLTPATCRGRGLGVRSVGTVRLRAMPGLRFSRCTMGTGQPSAFTGSVIHLSAVRFVGRALEAHHGTRSHTCEG